MAGVPRSFRLRVGAEDLLPRPQPSCLKEWECEDRPSEKPSNHSQMLPNEAATGYGSKERTPTGLQNDQREVKAEGGTSGTPGVAVEPFGGVVGLSKKHQ